MAATGASARHVAIAADTAGLFLVDHLARHSAVDHEIGAGDEARALAVEQERDHLGDVLRLAGPAGGVLQMVLAPQLLLLLAPDHDPAGAHAIHPYVRAET